MNTSSADEYEAPHLRIRKGLISPFVLVMGDPFRTEGLVKLCSEYKELAWNREYRTFNASYNGVDITVCSHGVGAPGAAICFEELIKLGARVIIRLGTCGSLKPDLLKQGDLVVSIAAAAEDGHSQNYVPAGFPAVADPEISLMLQESAKKLHNNVFMGITATHSIFYPGPGTGENKLQLLADSGCLSIEMENSALFTIALVRGIRSGACSVVDGSPLRLGDYDPHGVSVSEGKKRMLITGLDTITSLAAKYPNP